MRSGTTSRSERHSSQHGPGASCIASDGHLSVGGVWTGVVGKKQDGAAGAPEWVFRWAGQVAERIRKIKAWLTTVRAHAASHGYATFESVIQRVSTPKYVKLANLRPL